MTKKRTEVDKWLEAETPHKREALEIASRHFDRSDALTVNTLEAIYGRESSFGQSRRTKNINGAAGDFQLEKKTAKRMGLAVTEKNDQRFDIDDSSAAAAKYLKTLDHVFSKETKLSKGLKTTSIVNSTDRVKFAVAAYNAGEGRIAEAQQITKAHGGDPQKWEDVKKHLEDSGATSKKANEIRDYVDKVSAYEKEFGKKSKANKKEKYRKLRKSDRSSTEGHWVTLHGKHIFIENKK